MSDAQPLEIMQLTAKPPTQAMTPMDMIGQAIQNNSSIDIIEKLMALQERWEANQARKAFNEAISDAKAKIKPIIKNRNVDFTSQKGRTNYDYEDLAQIAETVDPILTNHGLNYRYRSRQDGKQLFITCILSHRAGHFEETELSAANDESGNKNSIQGVGSTATFLQRYTLKLALGLAATKDDDGRTAESTAKITDVQLDQLIALADDVEADKPAFCKYLSAAYRIEIKSFADIPASKFEVAKAALNKKRGK